MAKTEVMKTITKFHNLRKTKGCTMFQTHPKYCCKFIHREENQHAHLLANWARVKQTDLRVLPIPSFQMFNSCGIHGIGSIINESLVGMVM